MGKATGFMDYERKGPVQRSPRKRTKDWKEYELNLPEDELRVQGARCMDCAVPYCHTGKEINGETSGCPINNLIPEWNDLVYRDQWKEALERLHKTNNFPEFTGRVCPAPCEGSCTVGIYDPPVTIKGIEKAIIDKGFEEGWVSARPPKSRTGKKAAVIGSGPAGLACADQLNKAGHSVTVYERDDRIGGLLMYGIPNMKLDKTVVERRVRLLEQEGIAFVTNTEVGRDVSTERLRQEFDAVILCVGALNHRDLPIEGRDLKGIHFAMEYLHKNTKSLLDSDLQDGRYLTAQGKDVIVIGSGDTGVDCVATAVRHEARSIVQFGRSPKPPETRRENNPWPEAPNVFSVEYGHKEAEAVIGRDPREYQVVTKKFVGDENGQVKELHTVQAESQYDENGNRKLIEIPGTERIWPAQMVLIAVGFTGPEDTALDTIDRDANSNIEAAYGTYQTNVEGVFAAGDARRGQSLIVWAINEGREAAREVDKYLMQTPVSPLP